jgi:hypothetical protein
VRFSVAVLWTLVPIAVVVIVCVAPLNTWRACQRRTAAASTRSLLPALRERDCSVELFAESAVFVPVGAVLAHLLQQRHELTEAAN